MIDSPGLKALKEMLPNNWKRAAGQDDPTERNDTEATEALRKALMC